MKVKDLKPVGIDPLVEIIKLTLATAYIKGAKPASLLIIARPESAKTISMALFRKHGDVFYTNEITSKMLIDYFLPHVVKGEMKFLLIPDILNCVEKQKATRQSFLNTIKSGIEEGISKIQSYHKQFESEEPVVFGLITAVTVTDFGKQRKYLESIGLLSRFIPFSYDYPMAKIQDIFDNIEKEKIATGKYDLAIKKVKKPVDIEGDDKIFASFRMIAMELASDYKGYGFRFQKNLQSLAKANAYLDGRKKVSNKDKDKIFELSKWMNFKFNSI